MSLRPLRPPSLRLRLALPTKQHPQQPFGYPSASTLYEHPTQEPQAAPGYPASTPSVPIAKTSCALKRWGDKLRVTGGCENLR
jgi:hypothetical protein